MCLITDFFWWLTRFCLGFWFVGLFTKGVSRSSDSCCSVTSFYIIISAINFVRLICSRWWDRAAPGILTKVVRGFVLSRPYFWQKSWLLWANLPLRFIKVARLRSYLCESFTSFLAVISWTRCFYSLRQLIFTLAHDLKVWALITKSRCFLVFAWPIKLIFINLFFRWCTTEMLLYETFKASRQRESQ